MVEPFAKPKTAETYARNIRLYVTPYLGEQRLDRLTVTDIRRWLRRLTTSCQCCAQGKDAARPRRQQRCCATGHCCEQRLSRRTIVDARASSGRPWPKQSPAGWSATTRPAQYGSREPAHVG